MPNSHFLKIIVASLLYLSVLSIPAHANTLFGSEPAAIGIAGNNEFLPVDEAYRLDIEIGESELLLSWTIEPAYYLYQDKFSFKIVDSKQALNPTYLSASQLKYDDYYEKELAVFYELAEVQFSIPSKVPASQPFILEVSSQGCADAGLCYPPLQQYFSIDLANSTATAIDKPRPTPTSTTTSTTATPATTPPESTSAADDTSLWLVLLLAIAGGTLLNLMPCVFPVLSIKALSLAKSGGKDMPAHGWAYTAGAVLTFVAIAALMLLARAGGEAIGWGFQLQSPFLIALLAYLFFAMGLSLSGLASFGTQLMGVGQNLTNSRNLRGSFFTGALATVVASPCTAPFMATALGYALTQPASIALLVFAALGFGMALPFILLCHSPKLAQKLPQPGAWMDTLKQFLAFPLYLSAIWLLWVLGRQAGSDAMALATIGLLLIAFALWLTHLPDKTPKGARIRFVIALICVLGALFLGNKVSPAAEDQTDQWQPYDPATLQTLLDQDRAVFVNLTADWCLTCLANEKITLETEALDQLFTEYNIVPLKGDWTNYNSDITALLEEYQRSGVPLYLYFAPGEDRAITLPQLLRFEHIKAAVTQESN